MYICRSLRCWVLRRYGVGCIRLFYTMYIHMYTAVASLTGAPTHTHIHTYIHTYIHASHIALIIPNYTYLCTHTHPSIAQRAYVNTFKKKKKKEIYHHELWKVLFFLGRARGRWRFLHGKKIKKKKGGGGGEGLSHGWRSMYVHTFVHAINTWRMWTTHTHIHMCVCARVRACIHVFAPRAMSHRRKQKPR